MTFLRLSVFGFGGPNAHLALMLDEVVEKRRWLDRERFLQLIAVTNLLPGPNSSEVAIHVGYTQRGWTGALATGAAAPDPVAALLFAAALAAAWWFRIGAVTLIGSGILLGILRAILS